ncbi:hypothetical protein [sulfur-oxidizing endosymbiont of Gigantopelta aegis]|uniref:hypothetical protein n=1 Tax=sulfur-oxidizing endosymbiont of Gigantopelta aegis TaxID=2794934 RepID=UPI0018DDFF1B|nr:hypothetical protein [sulfur-oxidizing endosymbiont of Gigantopelta aegis]
MQILIDINDEHPVKKLSFLDEFKNSGIMIKRTSEQSLHVRGYSEEYLKQHWRKLIMTHETPETDDDELSNAYIDYLNEKNSF